MNTNLHTKLFKVCTAMMLMFAFNLSAQENVAAWTFNDALAAPNTDPNYAANSGELAGIAYLYADGTSGSSAWMTAMEGNELTSYAGTTMNDPQMPQNASQALGFMRGTANSADGKSIVLRLPLIGNIDPMLSYAVRGSSNSFTSLQWAWSTDGMTYTNVGSSATTNNGSYSVNMIDMSAINELDNAQTAYFRLTFSGGSGSATEATRIDNIVISATQLPEPTQVMLVQCGTELASIGTTIYAENLNDSSAYRFEVKNMTTGETQYLVRTTRWFKLTMLPSYDYSTTYQIRVERQVGGEWSGYYGYSCEVMTPDVVGENGAATITDEQCGTTLATMNTNIFANNIPGVTGYRFRITNMTDGNVANAIQTIDRNTRWFNLTMLPTYHYGTTYMVEIAVKTTGDYSSFGTSCMIMSPAIPGMNNCGSTVASTNTIVSTSSLNYAQGYMFQLTDMNNQTVITIERPIQWFKFSMVPNYVPGHDYSIRVAPKTTGTYSQYGPACTFKAPGSVPTNVSNGPVEVAAALKAVASPNPYVSNFNVSLENKTEQPITVQVYDMIGNVVESRQVNAEELESQQFGNGYRQGVYNVIIKQGEVVKTLKVIKR
jgi:hypothetical protein